MQVDSIFTKRKLIMRKPLFALSLLVLSIGNAYAYLDPGTGSVLLQGLIAGLLAIGASWNSLKMYVSRIFSKNKDEKN